MPKWLLPLVIGIVLGAIVAPKLRTLPGFSALPQVGR